MLPGSLPIASRVTRTTMAAMARANTNHRYPWAPGPVALPVMAGAGGKLTVALNQGRKRAMTNTIRLEPMTISLPDQLRPIAAVEDALGGNSASAGSLVIVPPESGDIGAIVDPKPDANQENVSGGWLSVRDSQPPLSCG